MKMVDEEMRGTMIRMQLDNLCALLDAEMKRVSTLDYTGKEERKIVLTFSPENDFEGP